MSLDNIEKISKILSIIAIPLVLWWLGFQYQSADQRSKTAVEYVKLSISIINNKESADPQLLDWASRALDHYAEVKLGDPLVEAVAQGRANVSPSVAVSGWYAVIASLETQDEAMSFINKMMTSIPEELAVFELEVHRTKISKLYAVTIGSEISKSEALSRAKVARTAGWVSDAFAERNRSWIKQDI